MIPLLASAAKSKWGWLGACVLATALFVWVIFFAPVPAALQNRQWQLETVQTVGGAVLWTPNPGHFTMTFNDYAFQGHGACNTFNGDVRVTRLIDGLSFSWVFTTLVACLPSADANNESTFLGALKSATRYEVRADKLYIYYDASTKVLIFK